MEKFEKKKQIDCRVMLFTSERQMSRSVKCSLSNLISDRNNGVTDDIKTVVAPEDDISVLCAFNSYGDVCGYASVEDNCDALYLRELFVSYNERNNGYGRKLLQAVRRYAIKLKKDYVNLIVVADNTNAQRLYENFDFSYISSMPRGGYCMQIPALDSVVYQAKLLSHIALQYGVEHLIDGFREAINKENLLTCIEDFNEKNNNDMIDAQRMKDACVLLEEYILNGGNREHFKAFINEKLNQLSVEELQNYPKTMAIGSAEQIAAAAKYAEEFLIMENSEQVKQEGKKSFAKKIKR